MRANISIQEWLVFAKHVCPEVANQFKNFTELPNHRGAVPSLRDVNV